MDDVQEKSRYYLMPNGDSNFQTLEKKMVISLETHKIFFAVCDSCDARVAFRVKLPLSSYFKLMQ